MYVLGIDTGTQGTKTLVFDLEKAAVVAEASQSYDMIEGLPEGHREQDPALWIKAVDHTIRDCLKQLGADASRVSLVKSRHEVPGRSLGRVGRQGHRQGRCRNLGRRS